MNDYQKIAMIFKAYSDESRLRIIEQLRVSELCACNLLEALPISQSTLSHHMKILVESGMVTQRKAGKWTYYALSQSGTKEAVVLLDQLTKLDQNYQANCACDE